jgi:NADPH:quinone reductase-like Zn-dependent oxidoreductase
MAQTSQAKAQTMRAVALDKFGGPEALKIQNLPIPQIEAQEVLIRVEAAGVGAWDPFEREGPIGRNSSESDSGGHQFSNDLSNVAGDIRKVTQASGNKTL